MYNHLKLPILIVAALLLSFGAGCQQAAKTADTSPANQGPSSSSKPPSIPAATAAPAAASATGVQATQPGPQLAIVSIQVTSPNRVPVTVIPVSGKPGEISQVTVPARVWETLDLECISQDQPSHLLTYAWSSSSGKIGGKGNKVTWTAPGAGGDCTVTCKVTCDQGETAALTFTAVVKCCGD
jgi:hypothetical protein